MQRQVSCTGALEEHAGNEKAIDFIRSLKYSIHTGVAIIPLDRIFRAVSVSAIDLYGFVNDEVENLASKDLQD